MIGINWEKNGKPTKMKAEMVCFYSSLIIKMNAIVSMRNYQQKQPKVMYAYLRAGLNSSASYYFRSLRTDIKPEAAKKMNARVSMI